MGWLGLKVSVDAGLKHLKVISRGEDGGWESSNLWRSKG